MMDAGDHHQQRIEAALSSAIDKAEGPGSPPRLGAAIRYAVFPGGARIRPKLCLAVAQACGTDEPLIADAAAASIELLHCASLVHDDLPCFDNAAIRRGKPSVHKAFDERLAVLAGDALIVMAFDILAETCAYRPDRLAGLVKTVAYAGGMPVGIAAGQAWECETHADLSAYQQEKTGSLFAAATVAGALASGHDGEEWRALGDRLGEAFQIADDIRDVHADPKEIGKPVGQDDALGRPNAVLALGLPNAVRRLEALIESALESIPACRERAALQRQIRAQTQRFIPATLWQLVN